MPLLFEREGYWRCEHTDAGVFFVHIKQGVTQASVLDAFMDEARPHLQRLQPVLYLNDATDVQDAPLPMQWHLAQHMRRNAPFIAKSAVFGLTPARAFLVRSIVRAAGRDNVRVFPTRAACEGWLLDGATAAAAR